MPRNRNGEYEPQIVKKHQMDISAIEDKIIFLCSQGTSTLDIEKLYVKFWHRDGRYMGVQDYRQDSSSHTRIADRPLKRFYSLVMQDAIHYKVREEGSAVKKAIYIAIGTDLTGKKYVQRLGLA